MAINETSVAAVQGIIRCQLLEGQLEEAEQQIGFLVEIESSLENKAVCDAFARWCLLQGARRTWRSLARCSPPRSRRRPMW